MTISMGGQPGQRETMSADGEWIINEEPAVLFVAARRGGNAGWRSSLTFGQHSDKTAALCAMVFAIIPQL